jgi:uncharacterized membrane protein YeaQ/YmgE (transglycosylase-associated protein family)
LRGVLPLIKGQGLNICTNFQNGKSRFIKNPNTGKGKSMGIISWIVMGLIVGIVAKLIMPGKDPGGIIITILLGIAGAFVGGFIGSFLGFGPVTGFNLGSFLIATAGAVVLLILYRVITKK